MDRRRFFQAAALLAGVGMLASAQAPAALLPSNPVFGRSFTDLDGHDIPLSSELGHPVLINFWASWCAPCVREMPLLQSLHEQYPSLSLLGLAIDTPTNVERFLQKVPVDYRILLAGQQGIPLMRELGNKSAVLPFTVLFDTDGRIASRVVGELKDDDIRARVQQIL